MTENLHKLAESLEEAAPDNVLKREVLKNATTIRSALETRGEYSLEDEFGNVYHITPKNGHVQRSEEQ